MREARLGGWLAIGASLMLIGYLLAKHVSLNPLNVSTIVLGLTSGALALSLPDRLGGLVSALILLLLVMFSAAFGGLWVLYLPALLLVGIALVRIVATRSSTRPAS